MICRSYRQIDELPVAHLAYRCVGVRGVERINLLCHSHGPAYRDLAGTSVMVSNKGIIITKENGPNGSRYVLWGENGKRTYDDIEKLSHVNDDGSIDVKYADGREVTIDSRLTVKETRR